MVSHARSPELLHQPIPGLPHLLDIGIHIGLISQCSQGRRHRKAVDVVGAAHPGDPINHARIADGKAHAQARQPCGFGQRPQHEHIGVALEIHQGHHAVASEGLIELIHHHQGLGSGGGQLQDQLRCEAGAGGVVGITDQQEARGLP